MSKQSQLHVKHNTSNFSTIKPPFKSYKQASTKPSTIVGVAVVFLVPSIAIKTHSGPIDLSNVINWEVISQDKKDRRDSLGLCHYYVEPRHIVIDHRNLALLTTKKQATIALTGNLMALVLYKPLPVEEKKMSLG